MEAPNQRPAQSAEYHRPENAARTPSYPPASTIRRYPLPGATIADAVASVLDEVFGEELYRGLAPQTARDDHAID